MTFRFVTAIHSYLRLHRLSVQKPESYSDGGTKIEEIIQFQLGFCESSWGNKARIKSGSTLYLR